MLSFFGEQRLKDAVVARVEQHQRLDEIIQGRYWEQGRDGVMRGCSIGCALHSSDHMEYERLLGLPVALAYLNEHIFESLAPAECTSWPLRFIQAVPVGVDLSLVLPRFVHRLLVDPQGIRQVANAELFAVIETLTAIYARVLEGQPFDLNEVRACIKKVDVILQKSRYEFAARSVSSAATAAVYSSTGEAWLAAQRAIWSAQYVNASAGNAGIQIHRQADTLIDILQSYASCPIEISGPCEHRHRWLLESV